MDLSTNLWLILGHLFNFLIIFIMFAPFLWLSFSFGPVELVKYIRKVNRCRHLVKGTVTEVKHVVYGDDDKIPKPETSGETWEPAICYTYNDVDYKAGASVITPWQRHHVGQEVEIYINEKHPEEYYLRGERVVNIIACIFCTLLFAAFFAGFVRCLWKELA